MPEDQDRICVVIYCSFCGNRSARNVETGNEHDMVLYMTRAQVEQFRNERSSTSCVFCGSPMDIKELADED